MTYLLKKLDNLLRKINFYAKSHEMMHEVEMEENKRLNTAGILPREIILYEIAILIKIDVTNKFNEVAVIFERGI